MLGCRPPIGVICSTHRRGRISLSAGVNDLLALAKRHSKGRARSIMIAQSYYEAVIVGVRCSIDRSVRDTSPFIEPVAQALYPILMRELFEFVPSDSPGEIIHNRAQ